MIELLFVLTMVFVTYVIYSVSQEKPALDKPRQTEAADKSGSSVERATPATVSGGQSQPSSVTPLTAAAGRSISPPKPKPEPKPGKTAVARATRTGAAANVNKASVREPNTGEIASVAGNYRFLKRWIKEALVIEGLLEKVYKNNELDEQAEARIKKALASFQGMEKYRV